MAEAAVRNVKPIIRWAGGKQRLMHELLARVPDTFNTYYEPFIGGASVLLALAPKAAIVSDKNGELINFYQQLQVDWRSVVDVFKTFPLDETFYYELRGQDRSPTFLEIGAVQRAARFLYLNKTSFQGLWRVNTKKGYHNTPWGRPSKLTCDESDIATFVETTRDVSFSDLDFEQAVTPATAGDFVYIDPPYVPMSRTSSFTAYTLGGFEEDQQLRLRDCCRSLHDRGVQFMQSNSDCETTRELYASFNIDVVEVKRSISAKSSSRGTVTELIIRNY